MQRRIKSIHHQTSYEGGIGGGHVSFEYPNQACIKYFNDFLRGQENSEKHIAIFFSLWVSIEFQEVLATVALRRVSKEQACLRRFLPA